MQRLLVLGGSGLLGQYVCRQGLDQGRTVFSTYRSTPGAVPGARALPANLSDPTSLQEAFDRAKPDAVVLCAALTAVDYCEDHPEEARRVNAQGPGSVADLCSQRRVRLVQVSTDYVFDGEAGPYDEEAEPNPVNVYGRTKRQGEAAVLQRQPEAAVVRLCAVFGWNRLRDKPNSVTWILDRLRRGDPVPLFTDQRVSPSYAGEAAAVLLRLAAGNTAGILHVAPPDCVTRLELGQLVCEVFDQDESLLRPSTLGEVDLRARRPRHSCLVSRRWGKAPNTKVRSLRQALQNMRETE